MPCPYTQADLSAFIDGEVDDVTRQQIRNHLRDCRKCRREAASLTAVAQMVRGLPRAEPRRALAGDTDGLVERAPKPLRCTVVLPAASAYLDGELPEDEAASVVAHIATCDACYSVYRDLEGLTEVMGATERAAAPEGLQESILAAVAADNRVPARVLRGVCVAGRCAAPGLRCTARLAAAAVFVLALGYAVWYALRPVAEAPLHRTISPVVATSAPVRESIEPTDGAASLEPGPDERGQPASTHFAVRPDDVRSAVAAVTRRPPSDVAGPPAGPPPPPSSIARPESTGAPTVVVPPLPPAPVTRALPPPHVSPSPPSVAALPDPVGKSGEPDEPEREPATSVPDVRLAKDVPAGPGRERSPERGEPPRVAELPSPEGRPAPSEVEVIAPRTTGWTPVYRPAAGVDREALDAAARRIGATLEATKRTKAPSLSIHP